MTNPNMMPVRRDIRFALRTLGMAAGLAFRNYCAP